MGPPGVVSTAVIVMLLAGCSSGGEESRAASTSSAAPTSATPSASPTSEPASSDTPSPPPDSGPVKRLGERVRLATGSKMSVLTWQRVRRPGRPPAGGWWAADVDLCLTTAFGDLRDPVDTLRSQFRVELPDGTALEPESDARRRVEVWAKPGAVLLGGQCRRGEVVFDVPDGQPAQYFAATVSALGWQRWQLT